MRSQWLLGIAVALWLAYASASGARAQSRSAPRIAVVPVAAINVSDTEADVLVDRLRHDIGRALEVEILDREQTHARMGTGVKDACMSQARCIRDLGVKLAVDQILFVAIIRIGDRIQIEVTWADARTGNTMTREPVRLDSQEAPATMSERAAARLLPGAPSRLPARDSPPPDSGPPLATTSPGSVQPGAEAPGLPASSASPASLASPASADANVDVNDRPATGRRVTTGVSVAGGIAVAALVGGSVFGAQALSTERELRNVRDGDCAGGPPCPVDPARVDALERQRDIADVMFATAIVAGVTAGVLYWRSGRSVRSGASGTRVDVAAMPSGSAIIVSTSF
jgi:TolB-like protein